MKLYNISQDASPLLQKLKHADEKKFYLRKAIYELDRLSYERGTRSGDYSIREKIREINDELELYDGRIKTCDFGVRSNSSIYKEILLFFENRYLDNFILIEKIDSLKQIIKDQMEKDIEHNARYKEENYKRSAGNIFRDELEKDLKAFEPELLNTVIPYLKEFLIDVNELLFYDGVYKNMEKWSLTNVFEYTDKSYDDFKNNINYFIRISSKIIKNILTTDEVIALVDSILNNMEIKSKLLRFRNINGNSLNNIIIDSAGGYCSNHSAPGNFHLNTDTDQPAKGKGAQDGSQGRLEDVLENLRYLTEYKNTLDNIGDSLPKNLSGDRVKRYFFHSQDSGKISLKDIGDYLKDSLLFINEWLLIELKKNPDLYNQLKLIIDCLPAEIRFYKLFERANTIAAIESNQKINFWGELAQYISIEIAVDLISTIKLICNELKKAFIKTSLEVGLNNKTGLKKLAKKTDIIYTSYENAQKKIIKGISFLEKT